jgi:hypothetical protein
LAESIFLVACYVLLTYPLGLERLFPKVLLLLILFIYLGRHHWALLQPKFIVAGMVFVTLTALVDARRHMLSYADEPGQRFERIAIERGAIFSSSPAVSRFGIFYQSIAHDYSRYVLRWLHDNQIEELIFEGDAIHPVAPAADGPIYFEMVSHGRSRAMQFDPSTRKVAQGLMPVPSEEIISAVSPDGKWTAYTSSIGGPKHIWLRNIASASAKPLTGGNCNSSSPAWELNSKTLIFASDCGRAIGLPALYRAEVATTSGE